MNCDSNIAVVVVVVRSPQYLASRTNQPDITPGLYPVIELLCFANQLRDQCSATMSISSYQILNLISAIPKPYIESTINFCWICMWVREFFGNAMVKTRSRRLNNWNCEEIFGYTHRQEKYLQRENLFSQVGIHVVRKKGPKVWGTSLSINDSLSEPKS